LTVAIRRIEESDVAENFDCGDEPLNNYLKRHAWTNQQKISIGVTYVAIDDSAPYTVLGYFTLATSSVPRDRFPKKHVRGLPPYDLPLILLARLAVDRRFCGRGLGHALLSEAQDHTPRGRRSRLSLHRHRRLSRQGRVVRPVWLYSPGRSTRDQPAENVSRCAHNPARIFG
jgi:GNAT superfamily N-acetyltransferase